MKKALFLFSVVLAVIMSLSMTAYAAETEITDNTAEPFFRYMGDVDDDSRVTSADARFILRVSVSLEQYRPDTLAYADMDYNGVIGASDARIALRTSVELEETVSHNFSECNEDYPTCQNEGKITGECVNCRQTADITIPKEPHWPEYMDCSGKTRCIICREEYPVAVTHYYSGYVCAECSYVDKTGFYYDLKKFVKENGCFDEGLYYYEEMKEYELFSLCYDPSDDLLYAMVSVGLSSDESDSVVYYLNFIDFNPDFSEYSIELDCYLDDDFVAYAVYDIEPSELSAESSGSLTLVEYDSIPELSVMQDEFAVISEGLAYETILWLNEFAQNNLFCDATVIMGFDKI